LAIGFKGCRYKAVIKTAIIKTTVILHIQLLILFTRVVNRYTAIEELTFSQIEDGSKRTNLEVTRPNESPIFFFVNLALLIIRLLDL
jgi:hypothetical protein